MKSAVAVISILCWCFVAQGQVVRFSQKDSAKTNEVVQMDSVNILLYKLAIDKQAVSQTILKANPTMNMADLLQKQSGIFIRSRGSGVLSTPSYKGLGSLQTPIRIDGANMQSSMNGTMDLSLVDAIHFSQLSIDGSQNTSLGMPNTGAAISLDGGTRKPQVSVTLGGGTLGSQNGNVQFANRFKKINYFVSAAASSSANKVHVNKYGLADSLLQNADAERLSVYQHIDYTISGSMAISNTVYLQDAERGIPPALGEQNNSRQEDANFMMLNKFKWNLGSAWLLNVENQLWKEQIVFNNAKTGVQTVSDVLNVNTNVGLKYFAKYSTVGLSVANTRADYTSDALSNGAQWNRWIPTLNLKRKIHKGAIYYEQSAVKYNEQWHTNARLEMRYALTQKYKVELSANKVYRLPVLNELYWYQPGSARGRADLKPEDGYRADVVLKRTGRSLQININPHWGKYTNWVQWSGNPETRPENIAQLQMFGAIAEATHTKRWGKNKLISQANFHWINATYDFAGEDTRDGKQLIFTPRYTGNFTITLQSTLWGAYINGQFVGTSYASSDNSSKLDPYVLFETGGFYQKKKWRIGGVISNILNTAYYTQPRTPLPGLSFNTYINYSLPLKP